MPTDKPVVYESLDDLVTAMDPDDTRRAYRVVMGGKHYAALAKGPETALRAVAEYAGARCERIDKTELLKATMRALRKTATK